MLNADKHLVSFIIIIIIVFVIFKNKTPSNVDTAGLPKGHSSLARKLILILFNIIFLAFAFIR